MIYPLAILFLIASTLVFWVSIFVFTTNPYSTTSRVGSALLMSLSLFLLTGALLYSSTTLNEYKNIFRLSSLVFYLTPVLWFHSSTIVSKYQKQNNRLMLMAGYLLAIAFGLLEFFTNLVFDYNTLVEPVSRFKFIYATGPLFPGAVIFIIFFFSLAALNYIKPFLLTNHKSGEWFKSLFPAISSVLFILGFSLIVVNYLVGHKIIVKETGEFIMSTSALLITVSVILNRLFIDGSRLNIIREFFYSSVSVLFISILYVGLILILGVKVPFNEILFFALLLFSVLLTHGIYDWIMSFVRNIFQGEISLPRVTDEEVSSALRNLQRPERLETSRLLRLKLVSTQNPKPSLDELRGLIKESIEYFKPDNIKKRTRVNLKYQLLKHIKDQVEEGQILWDLGFEEYPLGIAENSDGQEPRFKPISPTDYQAISRNAFISLKKEAIHDLAWRISYLEKRLK